MAGAKEIRTKIASVKNTQKITRAMKMVAAARLRRAQEAILRAIYDLYPQNSTNVEAGLRLGYQMAMNAFRPDAINRVILCSDGVANVEQSVGHSDIGEIEEVADEFEFAGVHRYGGRGVDDRARARRA